VRIELRLLYLLGFENFVEVSLQHRRDVLQAVGKG